MHLCKIYYYDMGPFIYLHNFEDKCFSSSCLLLKIFYLHRNDTGCHPEFAINFWYCFLRTSATKSKYFLFPIYCEWGQWLQFFWYFLSYRCNVQWPNDASFILPLIQKQKGEVPRKMGLYWDTATRKERNHFIQKLRAAREPAWGAGSLDGLGIIVPSVGVAPVQGARALPRATLFPRAAPAEDQSKDDDDHE